MSVSTVTRDQERAIEQRTRVREARFILKSVMDDAEPPPQVIEDELRAMYRRLGEIEMKFGESYSVRKSRNGKEAA